MRLFTKAKDIVPGDEWRVRDGDPFPPQSVAVILEVRDGWVRYRIGRTFPDNRMEEHTFRHCYRWHSNANGKEGGGE